MMRLELLNLIRTRIINENQHPISTNPLCLDLVRCRRIYVLRLEMESAVPNRHYELPTVAAAPYKGTGDLNKISGEQVIGMIPPALEGNIFYISMALQLMRKRTLQQWIYVECLMLLIS